MASCDGVAAGQDQGSYFAGLGDEEKLRSKRRIGESGMAVS
ncbi:hypothetical protein [Methylosarcina fibrata]|nr:hypothetical protein [Methylosarcina fibrata]